MLINLRSSVSLIVYIHIILKKRVSLHIKLNKDVLPEIFFYKAPLSNYWCPMIVLYFYTCTSSVCLLYVLSKVYQPKV